jgi:diguanylate cyclase (GGDEF)-like protein
MTVTDIFAKIIAVSKHSGLSAAEMAAEYEARPASGLPTRSKITLANGRIISQSKRPMADGGSVVLFEDVTEHERAVARAHYLATHDDLTGLANRVMFGQLLDEAIKIGRRYEQNFSIMFVDLDGFKSVNDRLGHAAGDNLLEQMATRIKQCLRDSDVAARIGGDEFAILLRQISDAEQAGAVARKLLSSIVRPIAIVGQECRVTASIGISIFPTDGQDRRILIKNADAAMYLAKAEGRNGFRFFTASIRNPMAQAV